MRHALLFTLALALPLQAQRNAPAGITRQAHMASDSLPVQAQRPAAARSRAVLIESIAGVGGALVGVVYTGAALMGCNDVMTVDDIGSFEGGVKESCFEHQLIGIGVVGPIGAAIATSMARSVTGTPGSAFAAWGGALLGTVIGAGASILLSSAVHEMDPAVAGISLMVLGQGTFAALAGRKPGWEK
jgi:hypothetical protein